MFDESKQHKAYSLCFYFSFQRRKFHWCVLSLSPFFCKLYESKLQEQQNGMGHSMQNVSLGIFGHPDQAACGSEMRIHSPVFGPDTCIFCLKIS